MIDLEAYLIVVVQGDVRVVIEVFGDLTHAVYENERIGKVREGILPHELSVFFFPVLRNFHNVRGEGIAPYYFTNQEIVK